MTESVHRALLEALLEDRSSWGSVFVVGAPDSGKTTFCQQLGRLLSTRGPAARIDCDPGQSTIGPPATVGGASEPVESSGDGTARTGPSSGEANAGESLPEGATVGDPSSEPGKTADSDSGRRGSGPFIRFVGSTSPDRHFLQLAVGVAHLQRRLREEGFDNLVFDSSGYYEAGGAAEFHRRMVDLVEPDHLVALQQDDELEPLLATFDRRDSVNVHRLGVSEQVRERSRAERRRHRRKSFRRHFVQGAVREIRLDGIGLQGHVPNLSDPEAVEDLLVGLCGRDGFLLGLGRLLEADPGARRLRAYIPPFDVEDLSAVAFGTLRLEPEETGESGLES